MKRLTRSTKDRMFAGILAGFGEYFNVDPTALRVLFLFFVLITGFFPGVLAYIIAIFLIPPDAERAHARTHEETPDAKNGSQHHP